MAKNENNDAGKNKKVHYFRNKKMRINASLKTYGVSS
jgi:hypothetical protein